MIQMCLKPQFPVLTYLDQQDHINHYIPESLTSLIRCFPHLSKLPIGHSLHGDFDPFIQLK